VRENFTEDVTGKDAHGPAPFPVYRSPADRNCWTLT
jgi:hypothetical protein